MNRPAIVRVWVALLVMSAGWIAAPTRANPVPETRTLKSFSGDLSTIVVPAENYHLSVAGGHVWLTWQPTTSDCRRQTVGPVGLALGPTQRYDCTGFESVQGHPDA